MIKSQLLAVTNDSFEEIIGYIESLNDQTQPHIRINEHNIGRIFDDFVQNIINKKELFYDDYCNWNKIVEYKNFIFNSGISYLIQFPNKPKRESTSISGGEKTLAAIVFVLALQKLKPSPFYLLNDMKVLERTWVSRMNQLSFVNIVAPHVLDNMIRHTISLFDFQTLAH